MIMQTEETINQNIKRMNAAAHCIENQYRDMKKERDDAIAFLRKCQRMSPSALCDAVDKYIDDYDIPF